MRMNREIVPIVHPFNPTVTAYMVRSSKNLFSVGNQDWANWLDVYHAPATHLRPQFAEYEQWLRDWHLVENSSGFFRCSCADGQKQYVCRHSIGVEYRFEGRSVLPKVSSLPLDTKRKPGRPKRVPPALMRDLNSIS